MTLNREVTKFVSEINHPMNEEIQYLRKLISSIDNKINENIKWNGPNYQFEGEDRLTMRTMPPKQVQLIFHYGAKVKKVSSRIEDENPSWIEWKSNDRAVASFKNLQEIMDRKTQLEGFIRSWLRFSV